MGFNNHQRFVQQQRQQQQQQQQRRQQAAWAQEEEKKRKRRKRFARFQEDEFDTDDMVGTGGGIQIRDSDNLQISGDMVGGGKYSNNYYPRDEKNGCLLFFERGFVFMLTFAFVGGIVFAVATNVASEGGLVVLVIGGVFAFLFSLLNMSQISRYRD